MTTVQFDEPLAGVGRIQLDRPDRLNALTFTMIGELHDLLDEVAGRADLKAVVLTGAGRAFCSGLDLADWGTPPEPGEHRYMVAGTNGQSFMSSVTQHIHELPQIVVAAVQGAAFGGGLALACAADVRIVASSARLCAAFIRTGLTGTDFGVSYLLPRLIGASRALDLIASGREIDGTEAERIGLASRVVDGDPGPAALDYAAVLAGYTRTGLTLTKQAFWHNVEAPGMAAALALEDRNQILAGGAPDVVAFMAAYRERVTGRGSSATTDQ